MMSSLSGLHAALVAFLLPVLATPLWSQGDPPLVRLSQPVVAELTASDPSLVGEGPFKLFRFTAEAGSEYDISVRSDEFSPAITIATSIGGVTDYLLSATDSGLGGATLVRYRSSADDTYLVLVKSADLALGEFELTIVPAITDERPALAPGEARADWVETETFHPFSAEAGRELEITARSRDFDVYLEVGRMSGGAFIAESSDDDGAGDTDARIYFTPSTGGEYYARVAPYSTGADFDGGSYAILLDDAVAMPDPRPLAVGQTGQGELEAGAVTLPDSSPFEDWVLPMAAGERYRIDVASSEFDTFVALGTLDERTFTELASNDDATDPTLDGDDSQLIYVARTDGDHILRVTPFDRESVGAYSVSVTAMEPPLSQPRGGELQIGELVLETLTDQDALLEFQWPHHAWTFTASAGTALTIDLASEQFDTYLSVGRVSDGMFVEMDVNDDWEGSGNGTDSRIDFVAPESGEFVVHVRAYGPEERGDYTLSILPPDTSAPQVPVAGRIEIGQSVTGTLTGGDPRLLDGSPYQAWLVDARVGQTLLIELSSVDFDTYLSVGRMEDGEFVQLAENDDGLTGSDSSVRLMVAADGEYLIRANTLLAEGRGAYTLRVTTLE